MFLGLLRCLGTPALFDTIRIMNMGKLTHVIEVQMFQHDWICACHRSPDFSTMAGYRQVGHTRVLEVQTF